MDQHTLAIRDFFSIALLLYYLYSMQIINSPTYKFTLHNIIPIFHRLPQLTVYQTCMTHFYSNLIAKQTSLTLSMPMMHLLSPLTQWSLIARITFRIVQEYLTTDYLVQGGRQRMLLEYYETDSVFYQREYISSQK